MLITRPLSDTAARGFTLVEVAFSMAILVTAVVATMMLLASNLRSQQRSTMGAYSSAVAMSLMERFQQGEEDLRRQQHGFREINAFSRRVPRSADHLIGGRGNHLGVPGRFDFETRLLAEQLIIPVPSAIARRLDSPGDEIGRMLDEGGRLYYLNPAQDTAEALRRSAGNREIGSSANKLVFGVVGKPQQNTLVNHPAVTPPRMMYPFPPQASHYTGDRDMFLRGWDEADWEFDNNSFLSGDLLATNVDTFRGGYGTSRMPTGYHAAAWEWESYVDELAGDALDDSPWRRSLPEFWRLVHYHWNRVYHQLEEYSYGKGDPVTNTILRPVYGDPVPVTITERVIRTDRGRNATWHEVERIVWERPIIGHEEHEVSSDRSHPLRGFPSPPLGLPNMQGGRGSDILYEDHETTARDRFSQIRIGLPGLQRRVMYRTAALALWGQVDGHGSITEADIRELSNVEHTGNPNVIQSGFSFPDGRNPLTDNIPLPDDLSDIHPAQVLALSYIAHAAIMVTGYKPPFVNENNSLDANQHENLVLDEDAPYKQPVAGEWYLLHPFYHDSAATNIIPYSEDLSLANQFYVVADSMSPEEMESLPEHWNVVELTEEEAQEDPRLARDLEGNPITYRRFAGPVVNPFPGPYADRGAFDWRGESRWARDGETLRMTNHGSLGGGELNDTAMARIALENSLRWAMAYARQSPYDMVVPKPANGPVGLDRPLFAYDVFDQAGNAIRGPSTMNWTNSNWRESHYYRVMWGSDSAYWPFVRGTGMGRNWSLWMWTNDRYNDHTTFPVTAGQRNDAGDMLGDGRYHDVLRLFNLNDNMYTKGASNGHPGSYRLGGHGGGDRMFTAIDELALWNGYVNPLQQNAATVTREQMRMSEAPAVSRSRWWYDEPFAVADRTRQLVFWSVDWLSYTDAESQPSEPIDYGFYGIQAERNFGGHNWPGSGYQTANQGALITRGHPEQAMMWANPARDGKHDDPPGAARYRSGQYWDERDDHQQAGISFRGIMYRPFDPVPYGWIGFWGADRNANGVWDRGRVPTSTRLAAEEVARFPFYDPIMWTKIGN